MPYTPEERKEHYLKNRDKILAKSRKFYANNTELMKQRAKEWRERHRAKILANAEKYRVENRSKIRQGAKDRNRKYRELVFNHYGNKCEYCGESNWEFLTIDHIGGGGSKHRKEIGAQGFYRWLVKNNYPSGLRTLCFNCNTSRGWFGYCPHKPEEI